MNDDNTPHNLPEAFAEDDPAEQHQPGQFGAGHLVGSAVPDTTRDERRSESASDADTETMVDEASEESFPGSDPPSYNRIPSA